MGMDGMMMWMLLWAVAALAVLALAAAGVVWLVRRSGPEGGYRPESPEEILKRRNASGEIDEDEFLRRRADMQ